MPNVDTSFNRERLKAIFLEKNGIISTIPVEDFDKHFEFEDPVDLGGTQTVIYDTTNNQLDSNRNTIVKVIAKVGSPYFGRKKLLYNRISIGDLPVISVDVDTETTIYQLLNKINEKYGLYLTELDIFNGLVTGSGQTVIDLAFRPTSLIFNDHVYVNLTIDGGDAQTILDPDEIVGGLTAVSE